MAVATQVRKWTLDELHRLPNDGNTYELVRGELFVTPPPTSGHETIAARLIEILGPYVRAQGLGHVYTPNSVVRLEGSLVEPDLMVRREHPRPTQTDDDWNTWPAPILVVEIASPFTRGRDAREKRQLYLDAGVPEYWLLDPEQRELRVVRAGRADVTTTGEYTWFPAGASQPLALDARELFLTPSS